jgi:hypothetical protein
VKEMAKNKRIVANRIKLMLGSANPNHGAYTIYAAAPNARVAEHGRI